MTIPELAEGTTAFVRGFLESEPSIAVPNPDVVDENVPVDPVSRLVRLEPYAKIILDAKMIKNLKTQQWTEKQECSLCGTVVPGGTSKKLRDKLSTACGLSKLWFLALGKTTDIKYIEAALRYLNEMKEDAKRNADKAKKGKAARKKRK